MQNAYTRLLENWSSRDSFWLICIVLFSTVVMSAIPVFGIPDGRDLSQHLQFAFTYYEAISNGDFFPGWGANENLGYGGIGIRFYPPIAYYLLALTRFITGNWYDATWINFLFWMILGSIGVYLLAKEWLSPKHSALAAMLYVITPYHLSQIYQLMLIAEFAAAGVLPFCFLFATRLCRLGRTSDLLLLSMSVAILVLTHIPTTLIGLTGLAIFTLFMIERETLKPTLLKLATAGVLSLLLSAFHWVKIVTEIGWLKHTATQYSSGFYDYALYLFPMYFNAGDKYGQRLLSLFDVMIVLTVLLILPSLIYFVLCRKSSIQDNSNQRVSLAIASTGLFSIFLMSSASTFLWESLPVLQKVQFPWRWLSVASLMAAIGFILPLSAVAGKGFKFSGIIRYTSVALIVIIALFDLTQSVMLAEPLARNKFESKITEWKSQSGCQCWWTNWASYKALREQELVKANDRDRVIDLWKAENRRVRFKAGEPAQVRIATFYYPYWEAKIDGVSVDVKRGGDGEILVPIPGSESTMILEFKEPFAVRTALIISGGSWFLLTLTFGYLFANRKRMN